MDETKYIPKVCLVLALFFLFGLTRKDFFRSSLWSFFQGKRFIYHRGVA